MNFHIAHKNKAVSALHRRVRAALVESGLTAGKLLVVAVSGGPDSLALLHALYHLRDDLGFDFHGAHLNHGLREDASKADAQFVADSFRRLGIGFTLEQADTPSFRRKHQLSLEQAARELRYAFLTRVAAEQQADAVVLGHTADDQAETVLMHILRGSGLVGLRGMETASGRVFNGSEIVMVRPLLSVSREETAQYCRALELEPRLDESNLSLELKRNWVRIQLIPLLQEYNPAVRDALIRLSRSVAKDLEYIEGEVNNVWRETVRHSDRGVTLNTGTFSRLAPALQNHLLRRALAALKGDLEDVEQDHIDSMARLMAGPAGRSLDLPGGIRFSVSYGEAMLASSEYDPCPLPVIEGEHILKIPGENLLPGWRVTASLVRQERDRRAPDFGRKTTAEYPVFHTAVLDYDRLDGQLWVRSRRPGDRFQPLGMSQTKKLQDFMVDSKTPRRWRDRVPLVVSPRGIAWVVGWRIAEWARVGDDTSTQLELRLLSER